jgi:hypothetical protein
MYQGASEQRPQNMCATFWPVYKLLSPNCFHNINILLSTDNWYTQFAMAEFCVDHGIHFNGTIKTNRKGLPPALSSKKLDLTRKRGEKWYKQRLITMTSLST